MTMAKETSWFLTACLIGKCHEALVSWSPAIIQAQKIQDILNYVLVFKYFQTSGKLE